MLWHWSAVLWVAQAAVPHAPVAQTRGIVVEERSVAELNAMMTTGESSSEAIVPAYLARIESIGRQGPVCAR